MNDYSQPLFYRFNQDSLKLVSHVLSKVTSATSVLDLCAGCGIIGIEISQKMNPQKICFIEAQEEFSEHLKENIKKFLDNFLGPQILITSLGEWSPQSKFDLIVCNPPYYLPGHGELSKNKHRAIARTFLIDDWNILFNKIVMALSSEGRAFIVVKNNPVIISHIKMCAKEILLSYFCLGDIIILEISHLNID